MSQIEKNPLIISIRFDVFCARAFSECATAALHTASSFLSFLIIPPPTHTPIWKVCCVKHRGPDDRCCSALNKRTLSSLKMSWKQLLKSSFCFKIGENLHFGVERERHFYVPVSRAETLKESPVQDAYLTNIVGLWIVIIIIIIPTFYWEGCVIEAQVSYSKRQIDDIYCVHYSQHFSTHFFLHAPPPLSKTQIDSLQRKLLTIMERTIDMSVPNERLIHHYPMSLLGLHHKGNPDSPLG